MKFSTGNIDCSQIVATKLWVWIFHVKVLNQADEAKEEASVYIPSYYSFWIATGKKRSLCQFMLDKGLLCGRNSRNSVAVASNNTSVNRTTSNSMPDPGLQTLRKLKEQQNLLFLGILLKRRKFLWWLPGHCSADIMMLLQLSQWIQFLYILLGINICFLSCI